MKNFLYITSLLLSFSSVSDAAVLLNNSGTIAGTSVTYTFSADWSYLNGTSTKGTGHEISQDTSAGVDGTITFSGLSAGEVLVFSVLPTVSGHTSSSPFTWNGASGSFASAEFNVTTGSGTWDISGVNQALFPDNNVTTTGGSVTGGSDNISYGEAWGSVILTATADVSGDVVVSYSSPGSGGIDGYAFDASVSAIPEPSSLAFLLLSSVGLLARRRRNLN